MIHATAVGRADAVTTNGEVFGADLDMRNSIDGMVTIRVSLTIGALTACLIRLYANDGATPTTPLYVSGVEQLYRLTATTAGLCFTVPVCGLRFFRVSVTGDAGFAGSSCAVDYFYNDYNVVQSVGTAARIS